MVLVISESIYSRGFSTTVSLAKIKSVYRKTSIPCKVARVGVFSKLYLNEVLPNLKNLEGLQL